MNKNPKKVLIFGTFDGLHPGHLDLFKQAKALGDHLTVVLALDSTIRKVKNREPVHTEAERMKAISDQDGVDDIRLGYEGDKYRVITEVQPDIIALGYDQTHFTDGLKDKLTELGIKAEILRLKPFHPERYKSSLLREQKNETSTSNKE